MSYMIHWLGFVARLTVFYIGVGVAAGAVTTTGITAYAFPIAAMTFGGGVLAGAVLVWLALGIRNGAPDPWSGLVQSIQALLGFRLARH